MLAVGWHARKGHEAWERDKTVKGTEKTQPCTTGLRSCAGSSNENNNERDGLLLRSETLHPSAYGALQGQLEEEIEKLQAELKSLTAGAG